MRTAISLRLHDLVVKYLIHLKAAVRISHLESYEMYKESKYEVSLKRKSGKQ